MSPKRKGIETQTSRMPSGMSSYKHACYYEAGLHHFIFIPMNSDKTKRGFHNHTQSKPRGLYWRFQAPPLEAHLISNNATVQLPPKTTPTTPPYATTFPFPLRLSRHFHLPHCLTPIYVIDFSSLAKDHPVDRVHENWAPHSTVLQPLQGLNHSGVQNQAHEPVSARNSVYLFMVLFNLLAPELFFLILAHSVYKM